MRQLELYDSNSTKTESITLHQGSEYILGRSSDADITLTAKGISRFHAKIELDHRGVIISDLDSLNGTFVNEKEINQAFLQPGDFIRIGGATLIFTETEDEPASVKGVSMGDSSIAVQDTAAGIAAPRSEPAPTGRSKKPEKVKKASLTEKLTSSPSFDERVKILSLLLVLMISSMLYSFIVILPAYRRTVQEEMLQTGKALTNFLGAINRDPLISGKTLLLDTKSIRSERGVIGAYILDVDGKILEPATLSTRIDPISQKAAAANRFYTQEYPGGKFVFSVPIKKDDKTRIGTARVDFQMESLNQLIRKTSVLFVIGVLLITVGAVIFSRKILDMVLRPLAHLKGEIDLCIKNNLTTEVRHTRNEQINNIIDAVNRLINRFRHTESTAGVGSSSHAIHSGGAPHEQHLLDILPMGIITLDETFKVETVSKRARQLLQISMQYAAPGKHLLEVLPPGPRLSGIMNGIKELSRNEQYSFSWTESLKDIERGLPLQFHISRTKQTGDKRIAWAITIFEQRS